MTAIFVALALAASGPKMEELGPTQKNGTVNSRASTAGLMVNLAGDRQTLYVVSLNSGVWKSEAGSPWVQLANSPACAYSIAVDPSNKKHLVVGERNGLAKDVALNRNGLWESWDAGATWRFAFDPLSLPGCGTQAIPAVAFSPRGTLFVATGGGVGRRTRGARDLDFSGSPKGCGLVTAVAAGEHVVWARTRSQLMLSRDDGRTWTTKPFPARIDGKEITFASRGDVFSLGATDNLAYTPYIPVPTPDNRNNVLYFDANADRWLTQVLDTGNGTGLGGRRFARSFYIPNAKLKNEIGGRMQLFLGAGQEIHQAVVVNPDGTLKWDVAIQAAWGGPYKRQPNDIHPDTWDILIPSDYDPAEPTGWVACDGGVYEPKQPPNAHVSRMWAMKWVTRNEKLFTHHAHTITVLPVPGGRSRLAYPTADNDGWFWDGKSGWLAELYMGDVNFTVGDAANPAFAVLWRNISLAMCTAFGGPVPGGAGFKEYEAIMLNPLLQFDGPYGFNLIQSLKGEHPDYPFGDALMLATPPLQVRDKEWKLQNVPGPLGTDMGGPVLLRNTEFARGPDANVSKFQNWRVFASDLPKGTQGFWAAGGHRNPTVVVAAVQAGKARLLKRTGMSGDWKEIALVAEGTAQTAMIGEAQLRVAYDTGVPPLPFADVNAADMEEREPALGSMHGPVFMNPYDPNRLFVLTKGGVLSSTDGGDRFKVDRALTALVTGSGMYPISTGNLSGNSRDVPLAGRENSMATLTHMCFLRDDPQVIVASSPFTGVFVSLDSGKSWRDLTPFLPKPFSPVPSVGVDRDAVYAVPYGRSVVRVTGYRSAPTATYFARSGGVWRLMGGNGVPIANAKVRVRAWDSQRRTDAVLAYVRSPWQPLQRLPRHGVVELSFEGDFRHAPSLTRFTVE